MKEILFILCSFIILNTSTLLAQKNFYIDSQNGNDTYDGLTQQTAWKSHTKVNNVTLQPGDTVFLRKGSQFSGPMVISDSGSKEKPIVITSYGQGNKPRITNPYDTVMHGNCVQMKGSWLILDGLHFHDTPKTANAGRLNSIFLCGAVLNAEKANHNIIRNNDFTDVTKGIQSTGEYTLITNNYIEGVSHSLWWDGGRNSWGPMGIHLGIGNQEVSYNTIKNFLSLESGYGSDGGAIEFDDGRFHKQNLYIHHNYSEGNAGFFESSWTYDNNPSVQQVYNLKMAFNVCFDGQDWLYMWAPCNDCYIDNNTVLRHKTFGSPLNDGVYTDFGGINFRNNLFVYTSNAYQGPGVGTLIRSNNWYLNFNNWTAKHSDPNQAGSGNPKLVDMNGSDYHLAAGSPLIGKGMNLSSLYSIDYEGKTLPSSGAWDIGAYSFKAGPRAEIAIVVNDLTVQFDGSGSSTSDGSTINSYTWNFGDGTTATGVSVSHTYAAAGKYTVTLTIITNQNDTAKATASIYLVAPPIKNSWCSYDVKLQASSPQATVSDGVTTVDIKLYESSDNNGVLEGVLLTPFNPGSHSDGFNNVNGFWGGTYPYVGKSAVARGDDTNESNAAEPLGVYDLQMHPPNNDHLTVFAFQVPADGNYMITDLAARRVYNDGSSIEFQVFDQNKTKLATVLSTTRAWTADTKTYLLNNMTKGNIIYFAVDRVENYNYDAAEVAWTVKLDDLAQLNDHYEGNTQIKLYPVPAKQSIYIEGECSAMIELYTIHGYLIFKTVKNNDLHRLDISNYPAGIYLIKVKGVGFVETKKIVVE